MCTKRHDSYYIFNKLWFLIWILVIFFKVIFFYHFKPQCARFLFPYIYIYISLYINSSYIYISSLTKFLSNTLTFLLVVVTNDNLTSFSHLFNNKPHCQSQCFCLHRNRTADHHIATIISCDVYCYLRSQSNPMKYKAFWASCLFLMIVKVMWLPSSSACKKKTLKNSNTPWPIINLYFYILRQLPPGHLDEFFFPCHVFACCKCHLAGLLQGILLSCMKH